MGEDAAVFTVGIIGLLTGLVGFATGLVAVWGWIHGPMPIALQTPPGCAVQGHQAHGLGYLGQGEAILVECPGAVPVWISVQ